MPRASLRSAPTHSLCAPRVLVVGTGARGGIGRYEHLLQRALDDLAREERIRVDYLWRRTHPAYLLNGDPAPGLGDQAEKSIARYAAEIAQATAVTRPQLVLFLHTRLARIAPVTRAMGTSRYAVVAYGDEVWHPLDALSRAALTRAPSVLAISHHTAARIEQSQGRPTGTTAVTPLSLDPDFVSRLPKAARRRPGVPRLLAVSRLEAVSRYKGIDETIRALPDVIAALGDVELTVVGDGDDRQYLTDLASHQGVAGQVHFRGFVDDAALAEAYRDADAFVLPSLEEGFGLVFLEAMAYGLPVVAANAGAAPEVVADGVTGRLVDSSAEIAEAVVAVLTETAQSTAMGDAARHRATAVFSFAAFRSAVDDAIQRLASARRSPRRPEYRPNVRREYASNE